MTNNDENAKDFIDKTPVFTGNLKFSNIIRNLFFFMSLFLFFFLWETHLEILILIDGCGSRDGLCGLFGGR